MRIVTVVSKTVDDFRRKGSGKILHASDRKQLKAKGPLTERLFMTHILTSRSLRRGSAVRLVLSGRTWSQDSQRCENGIPKMLSAHVFSCHSTHSSSHEHSNLTSVIHRMITLTTITEIISDTDSRGARSYTCTTNSTQICVEIINRNCTSSKSKWITTMGTKGRGCEWIWREWKIKAQRHSTKDKC